MPQSMPQPASRSERLEHGEKWIHVALNITEHCLDDITISETLQAALWPRNRIRTGAGSLLRLRRY